jgi:hypothetical protein
VYTAVACFSPETRSDWPTFVARSRLTHLHEVVSLDLFLCPNAFQELVAEDWEHNIHEDFKTHLFHDPDYVSRRFVGKVVTVSGSG